MNAEIELIAGYWTLAGDTYPFAKSEVSPFPLRHRIEAATIAGYGTAIALEMMPFGQINNFVRALGLVESAGASNGGLLVDLWHVARGGMDYNEVSTVPTKRIVSVELDDADAQPHGSLWEDTLHHRRLCGEGSLRPCEFIAVLRRAGYRGVYSVEIISREHRKRGLEEAALRAFETTMNQFAD
jgi:sugar phosphate isomerase/epimerase